MHTDGTATDNDVCHAFVSMSWPWAIHLSGEVTKTKLTSNLYTDKVQTLLRPKAAQRLLEEQTDGSWQIRFVRDVSAIFSVSAGSNVFASMENGWIWHVMPWYMMTLRKVGHSCWWIYSVRTLGACSLSCTFLKLQSLRPGTIRLFVTFRNIWWIRGKDQISLCSWL